MRTKLYFVAALVATMLASCADDKFVGENSPNVVQNESTENAIVFGNGFKAVTRANSTGKAAADLLGNEFYVTGVKGNGTGTGQTEVFNSYTVNWTENTAGTTESNTADWEYVGKENHFGLTGKQAIKFWDYNTTAYDFAAYSIGNGNTLIASGPATGTNIYGSAINYSTATTSAYTLQGEKDALIKCYITDMKTVTKDDVSEPYGKEVELQFRSLATKVRVALYETVPGYSVTDVEFFEDDATLRNTDINSNTSATLFGSGAFYASGTYTVSFPKIGSSNSSDDDYNKAHVAISGGVETTGNKQDFGNLNYTTAEDHEALSGSVYLGRTSTAPSFAGTGTWYKDLLPNENGATLELRVNYTLVPTDGANETIKIYGAKAFVPAAYTKWLPNYAYTYIFKISDNTNGWTNPTGDDDKAGLFPITFDAVVLDNELYGTQTTITTVAKPCITTYQKGHVYSASDEYIVPNNPDEDDAKLNDAIYAQVQNDGTLVTNLGESGKSYFYKISETASLELTAPAPANWPTGYYKDADCSDPAPSDFVAGTYYKKGPWSEASVMDALNIQESESSGTIKGRNGITLTPATAVYNVTKIPGEDGNWITKYNNGTSTPASIAAGMVAKLTPDAAGTYTYVYKVKSNSPTYVITTVVLTSAPTGWTSSDNIFYEDAACTKQANYGFTNSFTLSSEPADWNPVNNVYYTDAEMTKKANKPYENGTYYRKIWYRKYTNLNNEYGVKVIKVVAAP